jgi:hypothetical protein
MSSHLQEEENTPTFREHPAWGSVPTLRERSRPGGGGTFRERFTAGDPTLRERSLGARAYARAIINATDAIDARGKDVYAKQRC